MPTWQEVSQVLEQARQYAVRNLATNPKVSVHLERGDAVVILEAGAVRLARHDPAIVPQVAA